MIGVNIHNLRQRTVPDISTLDGSITEVSLLNAGRTQPIANILRPHEVIHNTISEIFLRICCVNPKSVKNKIISLFDYVLFNDFNLVAVTETRLGSNVSKICISEIVPIGYTMKHVPRGGKQGVVWPFYTKLSYHSASSYLVTMLKVVDERLERNFVINCP